MPINFSVDNIGSEYLSSPIWFSVIVVIIMLAIFYWNVHDSIDKKFDYMNNFLKMLVIGWVAVGILSLITFNYVETNYKKTYMTANGQDIIMATTQNVGNIRPNFYTDPGYAVNTPQLTMQQMQPQQIQPQQMQLPQQMQQIQPQQMQQMQPLQQM